jgi:hypothetical protein
MLRQAAGPKRDAVPAVPTAPAHHGWRCRPWAGGPSATDHTNLRHRAHHFSPADSKSLFTLNGCAKMHLTPAACNTSTARCQPYVASAPPPGQPWLTPTPLPRDRCQCAPRPVAHLPRSSVRSHYTGDADQSPRTADRSSMRSQTSQALRSQAVTASVWCDDSATAPAPTGRGRFRFSHDLGIITELIARPGCAGRAIPATPSAS